MMLPLIWIPLITLAPLSPLNKISRCLHFACIKLKDTLWIGHHWYQLAGLLLEITMAAYMSPHGPQGRDGQPTRDHSQAIPAALKNSNGAPQKRTFLHQHQVMAPSKSGMSEAKAEPQHSVSKSATQT